MLGPMCIVLSLAASPTFNHSLLFLFLALLSLLSLLSPSLSLPQRSKQPGSKWQVVTLEDGQVYYYHEDTRQTTWNVQDTFS